jgi:argininosuccinate lyase
LPSGYNRDLQETKEPFIKGSGAALLSIRVMELVVRGLEVREDRLLDGFRPEIFATDYALELVARGTPFRDAYQEVASALQSRGGPPPGEPGMDTDPRRAIERRRSTGATANLGLERCVAVLEEGLSGARAEAARIAGRIRALAGREVRLYRDP